MKFELERGQLHISNAIETKMIHDEARNIKA